MNTDSLIQKLTIYRGCLDNPNDWPYEIFDGVRNIVKEFMGGAGKDLTPNPPSTPSDASVSSGDNKTADLDPNYRQTITSEIRVVDEKALGLVQDRYAATNGKYKDMSIRQIIEDYESLRTPVPVSIDLEPIRRALYPFRPDTILEVENNGLYAKLFIKQARALMDAYVHLDSIESATTDRVSLEKGAEALFNLRNPHAPWGLELDKDWWLAQAKAVLDAAGVKYVD